MLCSKVRHRSFIWQWIHMLRFYGGKKEPCFRNKITQVLEKERNEIIPRFFLSYIIEIILSCTLSSFVFKIYNNFDDSFRRGYDFMLLTFVYHESCSVPVYYHYSVLPCSIAATVEWSTTLLWFKKRGKEIIQFLQTCRNYDYLGFIAHFSCCHKSWSCKSI